MLHRHHVWIESGCLRRGDRLIQNRSVAEHLGIQVQGIARTFAKNPGVKIQHVDLVQRSHEILR
jgi:hypothetical protein